VNVSTSSPLSRNRSEFDLPAPVRYGEHVFLYHHRNPSYKLSSLTLRVCLIWKSLGLGCLFSDSATIRIFADREPALTVLATLLSETNVVLYDDAGMGKTVLTRKLIELLIDSTAKLPDRPER